METLCLLEDISSMNEPNQINESLQLALKRIDEADCQEVSDWEGLLPGNKKTNTSRGKLLGDDKQPTESMQRVAFLNDQILRSATRMMHTENEIQTIHSESGSNMKKLQGIESEIQHQKALMQKIQGDTSDEEKQALLLFRDAMMKARLEYNRVKKLQKGKRNAKIQLIAAAQERLDTLRVSHEELARVHAQKAIDLEQKLKKEKLFYTVNLDTLAEAQQKLEEEEEIAMLAAAETASTASATTDESYLTSGYPQEDRPMSPTSAFGHPTSPQTTKTLSQIRSSATSESIASSYAGQGGKHSSSSLAILNFAAPSTTKPASSSTLSAEEESGTLKNHNNDLSMFKPTMSPLAYKFRPTSPTSVSSPRVNPAMSVSSSRPTSPVGANQEDEALLKYLHSW